MGDGVNRRDYGYYFVSVDMQAAGDDDDDVVAVASAAAKEQKAEGWYLLCSCGSASLPSPSRHQRIPLRNHRAECVQTLTLKRCMCRNNVTNPTSSSYILDASDPLTRMLIRIAAVKY